MNTNHEIVIEQLIAMILQGNAHATFDKSIENISFDNVGVKPYGLPYSIWQLVEHIRITQKDILDFSTNSDYQEIEWPKGYWPNEEVPANESEWQRAIQEIKQDREEFVTLLTLPESDIYTPFAHGDGQNLLREALLIADHTSYHTGQIVLVRRLLNDWKE